MKIHELIFSSRSGYRIVRHAAFWVLKFLLLTIWTVKNYFHTLPGQSPEEITADGIHPMITPAVGFNLLTDMIFCYCVAYWLWPQYLMKRKYGWFVLIFISLAVILHFARFITEAPAYILSIGINTALVHLSLDFLRSGPVGVFIFFITLKLIKEWHLKQEERQLLSTENAQAELQLLKAQVHPHFLFNTLNSIYSFTLAKSSQAADLVAKLSDMMRYMVVSGEAALVPLEKELKMIRDYIALEQVRYGDRLNLTFTVAGDYTDKLIAPMLMIPFVENAFKHGAGKTWPSPWIKLSLEIKNDRLFFELSNSKPAEPVTSPGKNGIGLSNIHKRLHLLYPGKHDLELRTMYDSFMVRLQVPLQVFDASSVSDEAALSGKTQSLAYAR
jgi:sensor histidine kinase YesM